MRTLLRFLLPLLLLPSILLGTAMAGERVKSVEGVINRVEIGADSCTVHLATAQGPLVVKRTPNLDGLTPKDRESFVEAVKSQPGKDWPSLMDSGSKARVAYLPGQPNLLVKIQVLAPAEQVWVVVVRSSRSQALAQTARGQAFSQGLSAEVIDTNRFPLLKGGFAAVIVGAFPTRVEAGDLLRQVRAQGWSDAYTRRAR